ncbi:T3SS effector OspC family protein [Burkholderia ubonensis]|uniref:T3SS effector OspC family protein n=1 Tax=Burkholderia ubonensis TaxID=101571 RepID=UPI0009B40A44|nr:T3SS effector OspC family protein [Burkholderia ubonensis]
MPIHINAPAFVSNRVIHQNNDKGLTPSAAPIANKIKDVRNSINSPIGASDDPKSTAAQKISTFLRKVVAAQSYGLMFANGSVFKKTGDALPKKGEHEAYGFSSLQKLDDISKKNISEIRSRLGALTNDEISLKEKITTAKWDFRHQTNAMLDDGKTLNIASNHALTRDNGSFRSKTFAEDKKILSNHDFIFFGVEYSGIGKEGRPQNSKHQTVDFGANAYVVSENFPSLRHGYLTLTDHFDTRLPPWRYPEHTDFFRRFSIAESELSRAIPKGAKYGDAPIFSFGDMKEAVALYLIYFLRNSKDSKFREYVLTQAMNSGLEMDRVLNGVFQAEFHAPRILSSRDYAKHALRDISLEEAVEATNYSELGGKISDRGEAASAMVHAINSGNDKVASYLFGKWTFSRQDFAHIRYDDVAYLLSEHNRSCYILDKFLSLNLVDVNAKFEHTNQGDTMLNNALIYSDERMISVLTKHGAKLKYAKSIPMIKNDVVNMLSRNFSKDELINYLNLGWERDDEFYKSFPEYKEAGLKERTEILKNLGVSESMLSINLRRDVEAQNFMLDART